MKKFIALSVFSYVFLSKIFAQDIHFTQFYAAPLVLNPANTGLFNGNIRGVVNYRNQWQSFAPFTTVAASVDYNFGQVALDNDLMGIGLSFFSDKAGDNDFSTTQANLSFAYIKALGSKFSRSYASVGFYAGMAQRSVNSATMTFGNQYNGYAYDPTLPTGENLAFNDFTFLDFGAGITWLFVPRNRTNLYAGAAFHHVNTPDQSFDANGQNLYMRSTYHAGAQIKISDNVDLVPGLLTQVQGPHYEFVGGTNLKYYMQTRASNEAAFSIGGWYRMGIDDVLEYKSDAAAVTARYDFMGLSAGLSYDITISGLKDASNSLGGPELSLIYYAELPHHDRKVDCPKF